MEDITNQLEKYTTEELEKIQEWLKTKLYERERNQFREEKEK